MIMKTEWSHFKNNCCTLLIMITAVVCTWTTYLFILTPRFNIKNMVNFFSHIIQHITQRTADGKRDDGRKNGRGERTIRPDRQSGTEKISVEQICPTW